MRFSLAVFASGLASSLTDWFFMGNLLCKRFNKHPEIWRYPGDNSIADGAGRIKLEANIATYKPGTNSVVGFMRGAWTSVKLETVGQSPL
jgi:hypothetical protein